MRKILTAGGAALCFLSATAAIAANSGGHGNTMEVFARCASIPNLWHAISTGNWAFIC